MEPRQAISTELAQSQSVVSSLPSGEVALQVFKVQCRRDQAILTVGCSPRFLPQQFGAVCGNDSSLTSMHLCSRNLPRPSASSPPGNRSHPMTNPSKVPDLEGLHREIHDMAEQMRIMNENNGRLMQLLTAANPNFLQRHPSLMSSDLAPLNRLGDRSHNVSTERARARVRRKRSPNRGDHTEARDKSTSQKIRDLDVRLDAINTGTNAPVTVDTLVRQTDPPFTERVLRVRISSKFKLPAQLGIYEGKTDPMDHLDLYKSLMSLQGCSDEVMCKAFSATLKGSARSWFRKLSPGTIDSFGELSRLFVANFMSCRNRQKNASHLFTVHQKEAESLKDFVKRFNQAVLEVEDPSDKSKADKYIAAEELAEAKRRRRGKDDHKRKEPYTRRADYREETRYKRPDRDPKRSNDRRPRTPPRRPEFTLPPLNAPVAQVLSEIKHEEFVKGYLRKYVAARPSPNFPERRYGDNRPTAGDIQTIHGGFGSGNYSTSSRKRHVRSAHRPAEEEVYNLSSSFVADQTPITFSNDDLRGLHLSHDDALVVSAVIANFNFRPPNSNYRNMGDDIEVLKDEVEQLALADPRETNNTKPLEEIVPISIHPEYPDRHIMIGTELTDELRFALINFLKENSDVFAWSQRDVPGVDPEIAMHKTVHRPETFSSSPKAKEQEFLKNQPQKKDLAHWIMFVDGSSNQHGCGAGLVIRAPSGEQMEYAIRMGFKATNNEAEYKALLVGLRVQGDYLAKDARMITYLGEVKAASAKIRKFKIHQIPREDNKEADALANLASIFEFISNRCIPLEFLANPSIGVANQILQTDENPTWMDEIIAYLQRGILPKDKLQARRLQYRSARFCIFKDELYKRSFSGSLLKCLRPEVAKYVLREIHEGICGNHSGARSLAKKNYSPRIFLADHRTGCGFIYKEMRQVSEHLVCRFGIPKVIISDNARQFDNDKFRLFCSGFAISHHFSSPGHPQANGQVEVTNRTILRNLKARLERSKSEWAEDLPSILWAYHTTSRIPTGETPYSLVFGTESVIPVEIGMPNFRTSNFDREINEAELRLDLDLLEEKREKAELRQVAYKCQVAKYYNQRVKHRSFLSGDLVLRKVNPVN
ncbi:hypothetical protein Acr_22g0008460 [Actinidia rufa]|uniref:Integrase catalytic domain-containing protein n=1 Tax=Actinidia rufa TaxID=165716 RepID=A0A7J0GL25_9ERIC|nr:hypothetical protein Acr_22g0008460 [Actinidia rufa]